VSQEEENVLLLPINLANARQTREQLLLRAEGLGEDHEETTDDGEVSEEEGEVKDEAVAESLGDDDAEKTANGVFDEAAGDDEGGAGEHDLGILLGAWVEGRSN
jgi:hypothetical protein